MRPCLRKLTSPCARRSLSWWLMVLSLTLAMAARSQTQSSSCARALRTRKRVGSARSLSLSVTASTASGLGRAASTRATASGCIRRISHSPLVSTAGAGMVLVVILTPSLCMGPSGGALLTGLEAQQPQGVGGHDDRGAGVGEDGRPEAGDAKQGGDQEDGFEAEGEGDVLADVAHGGAGELDEVADARGVLAQQRRSGGFERDVGAAAHGDADVGACQGGGVVDAVADHRDFAALLE